MTKTCKNVLITVILAICLLTCLCVAAACVTPQDDSVTYTITVQTDIDNPAKGVSVQICKGGALLGDSKTTDENGKVEFKLVPDNYEVELSDLPDGYHLENDNVTLTANKRDITVTLDKNFVYTVKLVDESGAPYYAQNVYVMICTLTGNCLAPVILPANGIAELTPIEGVSDYHVKVEGLPANYSVGKLDADGYYTGELFSATVTEMTITVYNITSVTNLTAMTEAEKTAYAQNNALYSSANGQQYPSYQVNQTLNAGKVAYFSITPEISGKYEFYTNNEVSYLTNDTEFVAGNSGNGLYNRLICEKGKTYFFKAVNNGTSTANVKFVMTTPYSSYIAQTGQGANLNLTIGKADTNAIIAFTPALAGTYTVTVECNAKTIVNALNSEPNQLIATTPADNEYSANPAPVTFVAYTSTLSRSCYIAVTAKADSYPVDVKVVITKTANANDTNTTVEVTETLTQYGKPANKELVGVSMDGTATLVYNETDRFYHLGTTDGPVVVVNITKPLDVSRFESGAILAYMDMATQGTTKYKFVTQKANGEDILNYTVFLRGFDEYDKKPGTHGNDLVIPAEISTEIYYAKFVNEDGMYPLTRELETFLKEFFKANKDYVKWNVGSATQDYEWLFPCYYYADKTGENTADAIVGNYQLVSLTENGSTYNIGDNYAPDPNVTPVTVTNTSITLDVKANNSFTLTDSLSIYDAEGTWSKAGNAYSLTVPDRLQDSNGATVDLVFNVAFNAENGTLTLSYTFEENTVTIALQKVTND